jgi:hypothetical protein
MNDDQVSHTIDEIESGLLHDDGAFVRRWRALRRTDIGTAVTVVVLLAAGAALLTFGLATSSWIAYATGMLAFLTSFAVDEHHKHVLRRTPNPE